MSRGLGKVQQALIAHLDTDHWEEIDTLVAHAFYPERADENGEIWDTTHTQGEHASVYRALRTLEKRGLVELDIHKVRLIELPLYQSNLGGARRRVLARLKC